MRENAPTVRNSVPRIRVALVDDDPHFRLVVGSVLAASGRHEVVASVGTAEEASMWEESVRPDVMMLDIGLPGRTGVELAAELRTKFPATLIIMVTGRSDDAAVLDAIRAGAVGYVVKSAETNKVIEAIDDALAGGAPMSPAIARRVLLLMHQNAVGRPVAEPESELAELTAREIAVLDMVAKGASDKEVGEKLGLARSTVKNCLMTIYNKWRVRSRTEAAVKFVRVGGLRG